MITQQNIEDHREEWGEESALYVGSVLGQFPAKLDDVLVSLTEATQAARRRLRPSGPVILGCDVARFGHDKTVVVRRQGPVARIVWRVQGYDTMATVAFLSSYCKRRRVDALVVDETGVGAGVVDRLRELRLGCRLVPFNGGKRALASDRYHNRSAEVWFAMSEQYHSGEIDTDDDPALIGQVSGRTYEVRGDGRTRLESKTKMYKSPDEADALAMTFAAPRGGNRIWT